MKFKLVTDHFIHIPQLDTQCNLFMLNKEKPYDIFTCCETEWKFSSRTLTPKLHVGTDSVT